MVDYFYDAQIRRFLLQVVRAFSGFQYETGIKEDGAKQMKVVPCRMAAQNRQVAHIMRNNSENTLLSVPLITVFIKDVELNRDRTQNPNFVGSVQVEERGVDPATGQYTDEVGAKYTVDRIMPHPLQINLQVDVWTSNELQKHQLFEQIFMAFNVGFDIQSSDNPLDWTALTTMELTGVTWSSRSIPIGTNDEIDVLSFTFKLPVWISPPAKVKKQVLIHQIADNIYNGSADEEDLIDGRASIPGGYGEFLSRDISTPGNYQISISGDQITLVGNGDEEPRWDKLIAQYGILKPAESQLRLRADIEQDIELDIVGTIQYHATRPNVLLWQVDIDTLPSNTLTPVNALINPLEHFPGRELPAPADGQRYLILSDIGPSQAWGPINAKSGDIIQYNNGLWNVAFNSSLNSSTQYVVNLRTGKQLRFLDGNWIMAVDGTYNPGFWRLYL